jgi:serine/threonine-protein kinase HipA
VQLSENRKLLVAGRFDLSAGGTYLGIEDFCVLDARRAHGRYDGSYENIARRVSDFVSANALAEAREQYALMVAFACAIENGDAHLKNFAVTYETPEREVRLAPAYDIVSTTPYIPRDTLALTLNGSKTFPERAQLIRFMRFVTSRTQRAVVELLDRVAYGVSVSIARAREYGMRHADARSFADRLIEAMTRGLRRLGLQPVSVHGQEG